MNHYQRKDLGGNAGPTACYFYHICIGRTGIDGTSCAHMDPSTDLDTLFKGFVPIKKTLLPGS